MSNIIGIDFGTSYTYIVHGVEENGEFNVTKIAGNLYGDYVNYTMNVGQGKGIKTLIGYDADKGIWKIGCLAEEAISNYSISKENAETDLKKKLRDLASVYGDVDPDNWTDIEKAAWGRFITKADETKKYYPATELAKIYLSTIFVRHIKCDANSIYPSVKKIVIGMPSVCGANENYVKLIKQYVLLPLIKEPPAGINKNLWFNPDTEIEVIEEPILAGCACLQEQGLIDSKYIFVVDIGGGTADYAVLQKLPDGKLKVCKFAGGGTEPAGSDIDRTLREAILERFPDIILEENAIIKAKEELFESKLSLSDGGIDLLHYDYASENIHRDKLIQIFPDPEKRNIKVYSDYLNYGRRTQIVAFKKNNQRFKINIAFAEKHKNANDVKYYFPFRKLDWGVAQQNNNTVVFEYKLNKILNEKFIGGDKGIKQFYNSVAKEYDFDAIAFVGGTSNVIELRNKVCEALNIDKIDGEYKNGQAHTIRKDGQVKNVKLFFTSETGGEITCSNAVAMGALLQQGNRQETSRLISRPDIYLQLFGPNNEMIQEDMLFSGSDASKYKRLYKFKRTYENYKQDNPDKEYKIKFKIKQVYGQSKEKVYPKRNFFSVALTKDQFERDVKVYFIVHKMGSGDMHYTGSLKQGQSIRTEEIIWGRYCIYIIIDEYKNEGNGQRPNIDLFYEFHDDEGKKRAIPIRNTRGTLKECKCYDIVFSQGDSDGKAKSYGWCSPLNKEGFYDNKQKLIKDKIGRNNE